MEKIKDSSDNAKKASKKVTTKKSTQTQLKKELAQTKKEVELIREKYLRTIADWENYKKRTNREIACVSERSKADLIKDLLPVIDDFDRAIKSTHDSTDIEAVKQGLALIQNKFMEFLKTNGVKEIEAKGLDLDTDVHEAITKFPVEDKMLKGKIVDVVEKGYKLSDKVIRFSKVVVGE